MNKIKTYLDYLKQHQRNVEAVIIIAVIAAVLVFGLNGEKEPVPEENAQKQENLYEEEAKGETEENSDYEYEDDQVNSEAEPEMYVDISGCVKKPGIYKIRRNTRLFEVIELAGGLTKDADYNGFNQAERIEDGDKIIIPGKGDEDGETMPSQGTSSASGGKININTADSMALQEIPGVGPSTAEKIISYREENGRFHKKEDLMNISGIGEKTFEKMEDKITL